MPSVVIIVKAPKCPFLGLFPASRNVFFELSQTIVRISVDTTKIESSRDRLICIIQNRIRKTCEFEGSVLIAKVQPHKYVQLKSLNVITLGPGIFDHISQMITLTDDFNWLVYSKWYICNVITFSLISSRGFFCVSIVLFILIC